MAATNRSVAKTIREFFTNTRMAVVNSRIRGVFVDGTPIYNPQSTIINLMEVSHV